LDRELRHARRHPARGPLSAHRRAVELLRAGDVRAAAAATRPALCDGEELPAEVLDHLAPPAIEALELGRAPGRADWPIDALCWLPGLEAVVVVLAGPNHPTVHRWDRRGDGPRELVCLPRWSRLRGLVADAAGARLGLHVARGNRSEWRVHDVEHGRAAGKASSVRVDTQLGRWTHGWWREHVLCASDKGELWAWDLTGRPRSVQKAPQLEVADGTIVARRKRELFFYATPFAAEPCAVIPFPKQVGAAWSGLVAAAGRRVLVYDRERRQLSLWDAAGQELAGGQVPGLPTGYKVVAVRPCPAGSVVALRFQRKKRILLLDLRSQRARWIDTLLAPRDLVWSPDGQSLALPSHQGWLDVLRRP
jgi:hypothetical protein